LQADLNTTHCFAETAGAEMARGGVFHMVDCRGS
jgi:hypothetical protein